MRPINIMLVDDHIPTRDQVKTLLSHEADMRVIAIAGSAEEALELDRALHPDVVIMDIMLPGMNGIEGTRHILSEHPQAKILALSNHSGPALVHAVLEAGGLGYVRKHRAGEELVAAIRQVSTGQKYSNADTL
jgi:NarL family two-component system response regulator LiaR